MEKLYITQNRLNQWLDRILKHGMRVYAPVDKNGKTDFQRINSSSEVATDYAQTTQSVKKAVFPRAEALFSYKKEGNDTTLEESGTELIPDTVLWKVRPCDVAGFSPLTGIFNWDYKDKYYNARLKRTTLVSFSCSKSDEYCFCTSVNGSPGNTSGSDIQITLLTDEGALVEVFTSKGQALTGLFKEGFSEAKEINKKDYLAKVAVHFSPAQIKKKLDTAFESPIWKKQSERCLGCGACAFVCPTCACFDIQEEAKGATGKRIRCWDSCGFSMFTLHTSGHNPRPTQSTQWRQRILHKFVYMPERINETGCTGCGRCSRACPVDMNILEHLTSITASESHE